MNYPDGLSEGTPCAPWNDPENAPCARCKEPIDDDAAEQSERGWPDDLCSECANLAAVSSEHCECSDSGFCSPLHRDEWDALVRRAYNEAMANPRMSRNALDNFRRDNPVRFHALCKDDPGMLP